MRLHDCASTIRSKNAGPFECTIDIMFDDPSTFDAVIASPHFTRERIASIYGVDETAVRIHPFKRVRTIKVSMPRPDGGSGAATDRDVYGCQQHFPLADLDV